MIIAIIPARGGSKRIPRKNIKDFEGRPIIAYSIEAAKRTQLFKHIYVSTEDAEIAQVAAKYGAEVLERPARLADHLTGTQAVIQHHVMALGLGLSITDRICCIYPTCPLMRPSDIQIGRRELTVERHFAMSVGTDPLSDAGQFYWGWAQHFMHAKPLISPQTAMIPIPQSHVCDINTMLDWNFAVGQYRMLKKRREIL